MTEVVYIRRLPDHEQHLRVIHDDDNGFTVAVGYHSQIRVHGDTKEEVIEAMADLLEHEVDRDELRRVFAHSTGHVGLKRVKDRAGNLRKCAIGCVYSVPRTPESETWFLFMSMKTLSATAPALTEAVSKLRQFVHDARTDNAFLIAFMRGMIELERVLYDKLGVTDG